MLLAIAGICRELVLRHLALPALPLYLAMGWAGLAAAVPIERNIPSEALVFMLAGTACHLGMVWSFLPATAE